MKSVACPRSFEAEAMRDRRLGAAELASFERHLGTCDVCSREVRSLEALAAPLRDSATNGAGMDELHARRERTRLLLAFDQLPSAPPRPRPKLRWSSWQAGVAAVALIAVGIGLWRVRVDRTPNIAVYADGSTVWSGRTDGPHPKVVLERGALFVRVENGSSQAAPLRVVLPDGELEDIGTVFAVRAEEGHTTSVSVREGSVVLRLRGEPARVIRAGETWMREGPARPLARASDPAAHQPPAGAPVAPAPQPAAERGPTATRSAAQSDPARDFRAAIGLLEAGNNREAAAAFARYGARHPRDARAEDAAYLRVLAFHRAGARAEVERAAEQYLRDYPAGLRHVEVERWLPVRPPAAPVHER